MSSLYTFVFEVAGGTFVSQASGNDHNEAAQDWFQNLSSNVPANTLSEISVAELKAQVDDKELGLAALNNVKNAWCLSTMSDQGYLLVNVVKTQGD